MAFLRVVTAIAAVLAFLILVIGLNMANGAPQEASIAAIAVAVAVIPYVFTRALAGFSSLTAEQVRDAMAAALKQANAAQNEKSD